LRDRMAEAESARLVGRVAGFGLPGHGGPPLEILPEAWPRFLLAVSAERMTGVATAAAESGWLGLSTDQAHELLQWHRDAMHWALLVERKALGLTAAFEEEGIDVIVLKGASLAHTIYPDPSWRAFADLDLMVRTQDWERACELLQGLGLDRRLPEPRPSFDVRFGKAAVHTNGDGVEVDLHRTLVLGPFGLWMQPDELFARTVEFALGGRALRRLDDTSQFLHACVHALLGRNPPLLMPLRDVAQVAHGGDVDWLGVGDLSKRWRLHAVIQKAVATASATLGVELPEPAWRISTVAPTRRERRLLESYEEGGRDRGGPALSTLWAIPGVRGKAAYVRALLFPDQAFLAARGSRPLRRLLVPLRWVTGRRG
jgi:hypothetical protein